VRSAVDFLSSDGEFGGSEIDSFPAFFGRFDVDFSGLFCGLQDDLREAVEEAATRFFVGLLTVGIAVADADQGTVA
jgi:hypothetical protein